MATEDPSKKSEAGKELIGDFRGNAIGVKGGRESNLVSRIRSSFHKSTAASQLNGRSAAGQTTKNDGLPHGRAVDLRKE
jgi:hypothetical protein